MRFICLAILACVTSLYGEDPISPRIQQFLQGESLESFWADIREAGTPLIEGDNLVTFIYQGRGDEDHVVLAGGVAPGNPADNLMTNIEGTDIWFRTVELSPDVRVGYRFSPNGTMMPITAVTIEQFLEELNTEIPRWQADRYNPSSVQKPMPFSLLEMPEAPRSRWAEEDPRVSKGELERFTIESATLKNQRTISIYTPPGYDSNRLDAYPLLVAFDGGVYTTAIPTPVILDNLIAAGRIPPMVAIFIGNTSATSRTNELPCNPYFKTFVIEELMPWVRSNWNVTDRANERIVAGASFGGLAAAYLAFEHPDVFGNVLSQSGAFWWNNSYLIEQCRVSGPKKINFYLDVGTLETSRWFGERSFVEVNEEMRDLLRAKGCGVSYATFSGGHDYPCWRNTFANGLEALVGIAQEVQPSCTLTCEGEHQVVPDRIFYGAGRWLMEAYDCNQGAYTRYPLTAIESARVGQLISHAPVAESAREAVKLARKRITKRGDLPYATVEKQIEILYSLSATEFGRKLLLHQGLDGEMTDQVVLRKSLGESPVAKELASFIIDRAPVCLATQERFTIFQQVIDRELQDGQKVASLPCGLMSDLLTLDLTGHRGVELIGIDADLASIIGAGGRAEEAGLARNTSFHLADPWDLRVEEEYDILTSNGLSIYEKDDQRVVALYEQFYKALKPGGLLVTSTLTPPPQLDAGSEWQCELIDAGDLLQQKILLSDVVGAKWTAFRSTKFTRQLLKAAGFEDIEVLYDTAHLFPTITARKPK